MWLNYNPIKPEAEFYSRGSDARLPFLNYNPIKPEAEFYSRGTDARLPSLKSLPIQFALRTSIIVFKRIFHCLLLRVVRKRKDRTIE